MMEAVSGLITQHEPGLSLAHLASPPHVSESEAKLTRTISCLGTDYVSKYVQDTRKSLQLSSCVVSNIRRITANDKLLDGTNFNQLHTATVDIINAYFIKVLTKVKD